MNLRANFLIGLNNPRPFKCVYVPTWDRRPRSVSYSSTYRLA
jgi:hypothetical protein